MNKKEVAEREQVAFQAGIAYERNQTIDLISKQIESCPVGAKDCNGCEQDLRLINILLQAWETKSEDNSQTL